MRIAQVAPLTERVPPALYGGTERVVSYLTEELVHMGHEVTLFASGDSRTTARLVAPWPKALRLDGSTVDHLAPHVLMLEMVAQRQHEFDIIHFHCDYLHFPLSRRLKTSHVTTLHGRLNLPEIGALYREFSDPPVVSISDAQREPLPHANWQRTIHHGLPASLYEYGAGGDYLLFLGRIASEKRLDRAIEIAHRARTPLKVAAKVDPADRPYYEREIRHLLDEPLVDFIGEVDDGAKQSLLANALGVVFPIDWPEPFGLVMIEALACGTPVIAFDRGSVREVIDHGLTGFVVSSIDEAVDAVPRLRELDRRRCRSEFDRRFSARCMAENYVQLYLQVAQRRAQAEVEAAGDQVTADAHPSWDNVPSEAPWNPSQRAQPSSTLSQTSG